MNIHYRKSEKCRLCGSENLEIVVPLNPMPIATPNFLVPDADRNHPIFKEPVPLELNLCGDCGMLQVSYIGNAEIQYSNYIYTTSLSLGLTEHFRDYAEAVMDTIQPARGGLVVEIGSNDGTLLNFLKSHDMSVQGVDPALAIAEAATQAGIPTRAAFFSEAVANEILVSNGAAAIIIANNVLANIDDLSDIMKGVRALLANDGVFIIETQYGPDVIEGNLLDTVYHEHLSYFALKPLQAFYRRFDLEIINVDKTDTKGGSFRVSAQPTNGPRKVNSNVNELILDENRKDVFSKGYYKQLTDSLNDIKNNLSLLVSEVRAHGGKIAGYGVSVGTTTLLPQLDLAEQIDFLIDDDPNKDKVLSGPGYDIPVRPPEILYEEKPDLVIVFAWRYADPIMDKHQTYMDNGGRFVVPLPHVTLFPA